MDAPGRERAGSENGSAARAVRVIAVGRTGVDQHLRKDAAVELVRVRSALEAVGELSDAMGEAPERTVVVVGADAEPGAGDAGDASSVRDFIRALRRVDPMVRVLRAGVAGPGAAGAPLYDGRIDPGATPESVRAAVFGAAGTDHGAGATAEPARPAPAAGVPASAGGPPEFAVESLLEGSAAAGGARAVPPGDAELVRLMLKGADVSAAAARLVRQRAGDERVAFVRAEPGSAGAPPAGVPVAWRGRVFGWLSGTPSRPEELAAHAEWLALWLALQEQTARLREEAFLDPLTGAWNRRFCDRFLRAAIEEASRRRRSVTVLLFDIDDFKRFNDQYGHAAGDEILCEVLRLLRSVIRPEDRVCRVGGDEFVVVFHEPSGPRLPDSRPPDSIAAIAARFQEQVCRRRFPKLGPEAPGTLTVSGGLATYPWDGRTPEELLARADALLLESKRQGKNAITLGPGAIRACGGEPRG